jgi:hypothetical protein
MRGALLTPSPCHPLTPSCRLFFRRFEKLVSPAAASPRHNRNQPVRGVAREIDAKRSMGDLETESNP